MTIHHHSAMGYILVVNLFDMFKECSHNKVKKGRYKKMSVMSPQIGEFLIMATHHYSG